MIGIIGFEKRINAKQAADGLTAARLEPAVVAAAKVGEAALRAEVAKLGRVTGNLASSIGTKITRDGSRVFADVGFFGPKAAHAHLVEFGTVARFRRGAGAASSWNTRGRWVGMGVYPKNFVTRGPSLGTMPAFRPMTNARNSAFAGIEAEVSSRLVKVGEQALEVAAR